MGWIWEEEKARQREATMKPLPETIPRRGDLYHRLHVKSGPHEIYRFKKRYLLVDKFGMPTSEVSVYDLLESILRKIRMEQRGQ